MKIVIAGGTGFVGEGLIRVLASEKHHITVLTRHQPESGLPGVGYVRWDGKRQGPWAQELEGADAVLNFTGASLGGGWWTEQRKQRLIESRVAPTRALVEGMKRLATVPRVLINASGTGYYGSSEHIVTEEEGPGNDFMAHICDLWEHEAQQAEPLGVRVVRARMAVHLAADGGVLSPLLLPFRLFAGSVLGTGRQWFPWVHKEDAVSAIMFALKDDRLSGPVNVAAPGTVTMAEFCRTLGAVLHRPVFFRIPEAALRLTFGEMADLFLHGQKPSVQLLENAGFHFRYPQLREALEDVLVKQNVHTS